MHADLPCSNTFFRSKSYMAAYLRQFPVSEPVDEFDDRNRLYSIKVAINYSAMRPGSVRRKTCVPFALTPLNTNKLCQCSTFLSPS